MSRHHSATVAKSSHGAPIRNRCAVSAEVNALYCCTSKWAIEELNLGPHAYQASNGVIGQDRGERHSKGCGERRVIAGVSVPFRKTVAKSSQALTPLFGVSGLPCRPHPRITIIARERLGAA